MSPWLLFVLAALATYRVTHLINTDRLTRPLRMWLRARDDRQLGDDPDAGWWDPETEEAEDVGPREYFAHCPWCVSMYVGAVVATVTVLWGSNRVVVIGLLALAASAVTANISTREPE